MIDYIRKLVTHILGYPVWAIVLVFLAIVALIKIEGFFNLLQKAITMVLEQLCSIVLEGIFLIFKVVNAVEVYIVLLIDSLTGKTSSNGKIASLAIGVLSVASFYTTYQGMGSLVHNHIIVTLLTLGIQSILFTTSLRIGDNLILKDEDSSGIAYRNQIIVSLMICISSCIVAYLIGVFGLNYTIREKIYGILYIAAICSGVNAIVCIIRNLLQAECKNYLLGVILFIVYFAALCVSSFFSYNAFMSVMYPDEIRTIDTFQSYKSGILTALESLDQQVDNEYYGSVAQELERELSGAVQELKDADITSFLSEDEQKYYKDMQKYEDYISKKSELEVLQTKLSVLENQYNDLKTDIFVNSGGIGANTVKALEESREEYESQKEDYQGQIKVLQKDLNNIQITQHQIDEYERIKEKISEFGYSGKYVDALNTALLYLYKDQLTADEEQKLESSVEEIENAKYKYLEDSFFINDMKTMLRVYREYKNYCNTYDSSVKTILMENGIDNGYDSARENIQNAAYDIITRIPATQFVFQKDGGTIKTGFIRVADFLREIESYNRNANLNLNTIEKNIRGFLSNKLIGIMCSVMAILIDSMILFGGLLLQKNIDLSGKKEYTDQEKRRILSNLFNKPTRR